jgi:S1-C subfamily serine protease
LLALYVLEAKAQLYEIESPAASDAFTSCGSGAAIANNYVVTNSHVVDHRAGHQVVVGGNGVKAPGVVVAVNDACDLAIVKTAASLGQAARLGSTPQVGQSVTLLGMASGRVKTRVIPSNTYMDPGETIPVVQLAANSVPGDSGCGIFDDAGNLVAIAWGCTTRQEGNHANAVSVDSLERWIPQVELRLGALGVASERAIVSAPREGRQVFVGPYASQTQLPPSCACAPATLPPQPSLDTIQQSPLTQQQPLVAIPQPQVEPFARERSPIVVLIIR